MTITHLLEDFGALASGTPILLTDVSLEEYRLAAFEAGYQAGWDDAVKAQQDIAASVSADFAQNIRDLSFTYQEAHAGILGSMRPLVSKMVETVLPQLAKDTLGAHVAEILNDLVEIHGRQPVQIMTSPDGRELLASMLPQDVAFPVEVTGESTLSEGQVHIRFGQAAEHEIDMKALLSKIQTAVAGFFHSVKPNVEETA